MLIWHDMAQGDAITRYALRDGIRLVPMVAEQFLHVSTEFYALDHRRAYLGEHVPAHTPQWERIRAGLMQFSMELLYVPQPEDLLETLTVPGNSRPWLDQAVTKEPVAQQAAGNGIAAPGTRRLKIIHMDQVKEEPIDWLWWPYLYGLENIGAHP
jgi:hypothetical protein